MPMCETLDESIAGWRAAEAGFRADGNQGTANICAAAAKALEMEQATGVAVCSCCFQPWRAPH